MSITTFNVDFYNETLNIYFDDSYHAFVQVGKKYIPLMVYLKQYVPLGLHPAFLKRVAYVNREFNLEP